MVNRDSDLALPVSKGWLGVGLKKATGVPAGTVVPDIVASPAFTLKPNNSVPPYMSWTL